MLVITRQVSRTERWFVVLYMLALMVTLGFYVPFTMHWPKQAAPKK